MKLKHNIDYVLIDNEEGTQTGVGIKTGKYAGVLYRYHSAKFTEVDDYAKMTFGYTIMFSPKIPIDDLILDEEFHDFIGEILTEIIIAQTNHETRNYDPEEPDI